MKPPFGLDIECRVTKSNLSRESRRPRRTCAILGPLRNLRWRRAVEQHREKLPPPEPIRLEREVARVGRPARTLIVARAGCETTRVRAIRAHRPEVVRAVPLCVDDRVALRRPARLSMEAAGGDLADVGRSEEHTSELQSRQYLVCRL